MTKKQLESHRKTLAEMAERTNRVLDRDRRELSREEEPDMPGGPMPSTEDEPNEGLREVEIGLVANESNLLNEVLAALRRLDDGAFGKCETCGKDISNTRLLVLPHARQCVKCANVAQVVAR